MLWHSSFNITFNTIKPKCNDRLKKTFAFHIMATSISLACENNQHFEMPLLVSHTDDINANISRGSAFNWLKQISLAAQPIKSTIHADLGSYMSSVWNFCTHSSDIRELKQQQQWWLWKHHWKREFALLQTFSLRKQPTFCDATTGCPAK